MLIILFFFFFFVYSVTAPIHANVVALIMRYVNLAREGKPVIKHIRQGKSRAHDFWQVYIANICRRYVEMLEEQQAQLVCGLREFYNQAINGHPWPGKPLPKVNNGYPLTHDILQRLGVLKPIGIPHASGQTARFEDDLALMQKRLLESGSGFMHVSSQEHDNQGDMSQDSPSTYSDHGASSRMKLGHSLSSSFSQQAEYRDMSSIPNTFSECGSPTPSETDGLPSKRPVTAPASAAAGGPDVKWADESVGARPSTEPRYSQPNPDQPNKRLMTVQNFVPNQLPSPTLGVLRPTPQFVPPIQTTTTKAMPFPFPFGLDQPQSNPFRPSPGITPSNPAEPYRKHPSNPSEQPGLQLPPQPRPPIPHSAPSSEVINPAPVTSSPSLFAPMTIGLADSSLAASSEDQLEAAPWPNLLQEYVNLYGSDGEVDS